MLTGWHPDWFMLSCVLVAGVAYVLGARRVGSWPALHTVAFITGLIAVIWATCSRISMYAMVSFESHMIAHMMLSMLAPILLVLGAPVTLALRALPAVSDGHERSPRAWLAGLLHSRYSQFITQPLVVLAIFTFGLYGIYFTSAFSSLMSGHIGHMFMEVHFLLTGFLFAFTVIGIDPAPRPLPHWARLLMVLVAMSLHAFFAVAIMQATQPLGDAWYSQVRPPWIVTPLADTYAGGGVAWAIGEVPSMVLLVVVAVQWAISDDRLAARTDRESDRTNDAQLREYNERLRLLNERNSGSD
jgi:putative copper resistance protein D